MEKLLSKFALTHQLGLISDSFAEMQRNKLHALGLEKYFSAVIFTDDLPAGNAKPSPAAFEMISKQFAASPTNCVYIADNPSKDFLAPNKLGWLSIQYLRPEQIHSHLPAPAGGEPQKIVHSDDELLNLIV